MSESACLPDSNVWIALMFDSHPGHQAASDAVAALTDSKPAVFCRATQQSFLRLITTPALSRHYGVAEINNDQAINLLETFLASPAVVYRDEPPGISKAWLRRAARPLAAPRVWMDAYLAAFAITAGLKFITLDHGFTSFEAAGLDLSVLNFT